MYLVFFEFIYFFENRLCSVLPYHWSSSNWTFPIYLRSSSKAQIAWRQFDQLKKSFNVCSTLFWFWFFSNPSMKGSALFMYLVFFEFIYFFENRLCSVLPYHWSSSNWTFPIYLRSSSKAQIAWRQFDQLKKSFNVCSTLFWFWFFSNPSMKGFLILVLWPVLLLCCWFDLLNF